MGLYCSIAEDLYQDQVFSVADPFYDEAGNILDETSWAHVFDASDESTIETTGNNVDNWNDSVGSLVLAGGGTTNPQSGTRTVNGLNVVDMNDSTLIETAFAGIAQPFTIFAVFERDVNDGHALIRSTGGVTVLNVATNAGLNVSGVGSGIVSIPANGVPFVLTIVLNGSSSFLEINGTRNTPASSASAIGANIFIGNAGASSRLDGAVGEVRILGSAASDDLISSVVSALYSKWGVA